MSSTSAVKEEKGKEVGGALPASPPDLRHVLREKAANHRSFYRRLREKDKERGGDTEHQTPPPSPEPVAAALSLPIAMSGTGGLLSPPGRESPRSCAGSDEGCPGAADCSSDEEDRRCQRPDRPKSRDSAVDLDENPSLTVLSDAPSGEEKLKREDTIYYSEGENVFEDALDKGSYCEEHCCYHQVRSKMILEAQYVEYPLSENKDCELSAIADETAETDVFSPDDARRLSTLSLEGDEVPRVRMVRTPSVVVSDYSDDIHVGITPEELEYLRKHVETASNSSGRSSCNDSRRGSQLSVEEVDSRRNSQLSFASLDEVKHEVSPLVSEMEDDDKGPDNQKTKKITLQ